MEAFANWLGNTAVSLTFQSSSWFVPTVQTIHILAIAVVISSIGIIDFRLLGIGSKSQSITQLSQRFMPWIWRALIILALSGLLLVITEPGRELLNTLFWAKMAMLTAVIVVTVLFQRGVKNNRSMWDAPGGSSSAKLTALISLALWIGIVTAGRWIAYAGS